MPQISFSQHPQEGCVAAFPVIERDKTSKKATLEITHEGPWKLFSGSTVETINNTQPLLQGEGPGIFSVSANPEIREYFLLEQQGHTYVLAERHLPMAGGFNFRDLGGFAGADGKTVKWGMFFRADGLSKLTDEDLRYLASIPLVTIIDFRTVKEAEKKPDLLPASVQQSLHYPVMPGQLSGMASGEILPESIPSDFMETLNRLLVEDDEIIETYRKFFTIVQNEKSVPLLFHCSAGKDRTGYAAALILFALGVDKELIIQDYMASSVYLSDKYEDIINKHPHLEPLFTVRRSYIQSAIDAMERKSGSIENYLTQELGVDLKLMRERFLQ